MPNDVLFELLKDVEMCDNDTGIYYRVHSVMTEDDKTLVILELATK